MEQLAVSVLLGSLLVGSLWLWDKTTGIFQDNADDPYWHATATHPRSWVTKDSNNKRLKADMKDCHEWVDSATI